MVTIVSAPAATAPSASARWIACSRSLNFAACPPQA